MVYILSRARDVIDFSRLVTICFIFFFCISVTVNAQSRSGGLNPLPAPSVEKIGDLHYDLNKEVKVLAFIDALNDNLRGVNSDLFQTSYKFNEEYVQKWTTQYIPDGIEYNLKDLEPGFALVRQVTSDSYNVISSLCGLNYKAEVISYTPDYADPNKLSYMVKLKLQLTSPDNQSQLMNILLGYIDGRLLVFNVEKRAL